MKAVQRRSRISPDAALCLQFIGAARSVLFIGRQRDEILDALRASGCAVTHALPGIPLLVELFASEEFDAVILDDVLNRVENPKTLLADARTALRPGGCVVATVHNLSHRDNRLALVGAHPLPLKGLTSAGVRDLFWSAGYRVEQAQPVREPLLGSREVHSEILPATDDQPEASTYQFVVSATPIAAVRRDVRTFGLEREADVPARPVVLDHRLADLQHELDTERESREELIMALRDAQQFTAGFRNRIAELATRRSRLNAELDDKNRVIEGLRAVVAGLESRISEITARAHAAESQHHAMRTLADAERNAREEIHVALQLTQDRLGAVRDVATKAEHDWYSLQVQLSNLRIQHAAELGALSAAVAAGAAELASRTSQLDDARAQLDALTADFSDFRQSSARDREQAAADARQFEAALAGAQAVARESQARMAETRRTVVELQAEIADGSRYVSDLVRQLKEKDLQIAQGGVYARELEAKIVAQERENEVLTVELEAVRKAALADKVLMRDYVQSLQEQVVEIPALRAAQEKLVAQTEGLIASAQAESAQIVTLIDTVQGSHFWRLKRFVNRVRARVFRR